MQSATQYQCAVMVSDANNTMLIYSILYYVLKNYYILYTTSQKNDDDTEDWSNDAENH